MAEAKLICLLLALQSDPKWRKFSQLVEKTLQSFTQLDEYAARCA